MLRGAKHLNACPTKAQRHHQSHTCAPFDSPTPTHDGRAIIWPGGNSGAQEARGHSLPVYGEGRGGAHSLPVYGEGWGGAGQEAAQHHSGQPSCCFPARGGSPLLIPPHAGECPASDSPAFGMAHQRGERERSPLLIIRPTPGGGPCPCLALSCDRCRRRRPGRPGR